MATLPFSIGDVFISEVETLAYRYIRDGEFDTVLLRPASALLQILALEFELRRAGKLLAPTIVLCWAVANVEVDWTVGRVTMLVVAVISGTAIYSGFWVIAGSIPFWAVASREATNAMTYGSQFANQYPLHVYPAGSGRSWAGRCRWRSWPTSPPSRWPAPPIRSTSRPGWRSPRRRWPWRSGSSPVWSGEAGSPTIRARGVDHGG